MADASGFTDAEVLSAMQNFAERGFDDAANKWFAGSYSHDPESSRAGYQRWKSMKERMRVLVRQMKEAATAGATV